MSAIAQLLTALGLGGVIANALRSRASKSGEITNTLGEVVKTVAELSKRVVNLELRQVSYERHIDDLYISIAREGDEAEARVIGRLRTKRPAWEGEGK